MALVTEEGGGGEVMVVMERDWCVSFLKGRGGGSGSIGAEGEQARGAARPG
jgi:hypothetical protein